jgi:phosphopantetheinyl transferase
VAGLRAQRPKLGRWALISSGNGLAAITPEAARTSNAGIGAFYRIWTLREAIAKARGQGLALAADGLDRVHEGPDVGQWFATLDQAAWSLSHNLIDEDTSFATAVVLPEPCQAVRLERWVAEWP